MVDLRKCIGSTRFGIEPHEAPVEDFPKQRSQKDGLGRMCKTHWNQYTAGLARDAKARKAAAAAKAEDAATEPSRSMRRHRVRGASRRNRSPRTRRVPPHRRPDVASEAPGVIPGPFFVRQERSRPSARWSCRLLRRFAGRRSVDQQERDSSLSLGGAIPLAPTKLAEQRHPGSDPIEGPTELSSPAT